VKLETAFHHIRVWSESKKGGRYTLHISPEGDTTIERTVFIKNAIEGQGDDEIAYTEAIGQHN